MPADLTIFAAQCLVFIEALALLAAPPLTRLLLPYLPLPRWSDMGSRDHNRVA